MSSLFKVSRSFLLLSFLSLAIVTPSTLFPFIVGKYAWFRTSVDLALIAFLFGLLFQDSGAVMMRRLRDACRQPLVIAVSAFTGIFLLACLFGIDPSFSFWSSFERGEGGFQILHLWLFFSLLVVLVKENAEWRKVFAWAITGGVLVALYGFFAGVGVTGFLGGRFGSNGYRFPGSIGNPAYVAAVALFMLFFAAFLFWSRPRRLRSLATLGYFFIAAIFLAVFFSAATRGAFLGLIAVAVAVAGYFMFTHRQWRKWLIGGAAAILVIVGVLVYFKDSSFVKSIPGSRIFDISFSARTFEDRAIMWKIALDGFRERPLLGWGPENFITVFARHFNTDYFRPAEGFGAWFDRAHSLYFDYLVETGILGLVSFLSIFATFYWCLFGMVRRNSMEMVTGPGVHRNLPQKTSHASFLFSPFARALLFAVPVAYLVQGIVLFDVLPIYICVFLFLAFAASVFWNERATEKR